MTRLNPLGAVRAPTQAPGTIPSPVPGLTVLSSGEAAFQTMTGELDRCRARAEITVFIWHDDDTGNQLAEHALAAAERGVSLHIEKDRIGAIYEHIDPNKHSFFNKRLTLGERARVEALSWAYRRGPTRRQEPNALAERLASHPQVALRHGARRHDHSKVFIFDDERLLMGGVNVGDHFRHEWLDFMVRLDGARYVERYRARRAGRGGPIQGPVDFLVNTTPPGQARQFNVFPQRLAALEAARESVHIEMAYFGDGRILDALVRCVARGVEVTLVTAARANIVHDLNHRFIDQLRRRTGAPPHLHISLHPRMVHTKLMVFDRQVAQLGSSNFTTLSHAVYDEADLWLQCPETASALADAVAQHAAEGARVTGPVAYRRWAAAVEWVLQRPNPVSLGAPPERAAGARG